MQSSKFTRHEFKAIKRNRQSETTMQINTS